MEIGSNCSNFVARRDGWSRPLPLGAPRPMRLNWEILRDTVYFTDPMNFEISTNYLSEYILKIIRLPYKFFDSKIKSEFIQRIEDQARLQNFLSYRIISFTISILSFLVFSFLLLYYSAKIFIVFLILSVISFMWTMLFLKKRLSLDYGRFAAQSENRNTIQEILGQRIFPVGRCM